MKRLGVVWTQKAVHDLRRIQTFISYDKPSAARHFIFDLKLKVERLGKFPQSGRVVSELARPDIRELVVGNYRVIYRILSRRVAVLTVFPGRKRFEDMDDY